MIDRTDRTPIRAAALAALASRRGNPSIFTYYSQYFTAERRWRFLEAYYQRMPAPAIELAAGPGAQAALGAAMKGEGKL